MSYHGETNCIPTTSKHSDSLLMCNFRRAYTCIAFNRATNGQTYLKQEKEENVRTYVSQSLLIPASRPSSLETDMDTDYITGLHCGGEDSSGL